MIAVSSTEGGFTKELTNIVVDENKPFAIKFGTTRRRPDLSHIWPNSTAEKLIASGEPTAVNNGCDIPVTGEDGGGGFNVTMSCEAALPKHAGTYVGTDNDEAETAQKTTADVIVVSGLMLVSHLTSCDLLTLLYYIIMVSPCGKGQTIIFSSCGFFCFFFFFSSPNLSRRRLDVCHTSTHVVALVRI